MKAQIGGLRYSSTLSLTMALDGVGQSTPCSSCFTPGKVTHYPPYRRLGGSPGPVCTGDKPDFLMKFAIKEIC